MKTMLYSLLGTVSLLGAGPAAAAVIPVDCDQGETLADALALANPGDTILASGVCEESVVVVTDGVTLDGGGSAAVEAGFLDAVTADGVQRVEIRGFDLRDSFRGLVVQGGASVSVRDTTVRDNVTTGISVVGSSSLALRDSSVRDNGVFGVEVDRSSELEVTGSLTIEDSVFGMILTSSSSVTFRQATVGVHDNILGIQIGVNSSAILADAATTVDTSDNLTTGFTVVSTSTLFVFEGAIVSRDNLLNHGVSANSNSSIDLDRGGSITATDNGLDGVQLESSLLNMFNMPGLPGSFVVAEDNGRHGLSAFVESVIDLTVDSVITARDNADAGIRADNGSTIRVINSTLTGNSRDVDMSFAARADLGNNTIGTIECDASVLIRGDTGTTCPTRRRK